MHVIFELKEHLVTVTDNAVEQQLQQHADDITLRQTAIATLDQTIKEYEKEHDTIRLSAATFGAFLKMHSITPINDATEAYLQFLIKGEQDKVDVGGNDIKLNGLMEDLRRHKEIVKVLTDSTNSNPGSVDLSEANVGKMVQDLYRLKHFGKNLRSLQHGISLAHQATNRERPITVRRGPNGGSGRRPPKLEIRNPKPASYAYNEPYRTASHGGGAGMTTTQFLRGAYNKAKNTIWR
jgi:hypothetical protein